MSEWTKVWTCKIGEVDPSDVPNGADQPMRESVARTYQRITGRDPVFIFSGWGGELTEPERAVVENRMPSEEHYQAWLAEQERAASGVSQPPARELPTVDERVFRALDNAVKNGYEMHDQPPEVVADDLRDHDAGLEDVGTDALASAVVAWRKSRPTRPGICGEPTPEQVEAGARALCGLGIRAMDGTPATWERHAESFRDTVRAVLTAAAFAKGEADGK